MADVEGVQLIDCRIIDDRRGRQTEAVPLGLGITVQDAGVQIEFLRRLVVGGEGDGMNFAVIVGAVTGRPKLGRYDDPRSAIVPALAEVRLRALGVVTIGEGNVEILGWGIPDGKPRA